MEDKIFDISFEFDNKQYNGWVNPAEDLNGSGTPVSFHVVLDDTSFGYVSYRDCNWMVNEERPEGLVKQIGKEIEKYYKL
ncbi:MAG: hypothetical protein ACHQFX_07530 [Chitinophagales bacterium]